MKKARKKFSCIENRDRFFCAEIVILFISFMLFVFAPFEIYLSAKEEFFFEGYEMVEFFLLCAGCLFIALSVANIICMAISKKFHNIFFAVLFSLSIALYIQGNYIVVDYGVLDGTAINWADYRMEGFVSHAMFVGIILIGLVLLKKVQIIKYMKVASGISVCLILVQLVTLVVLLLQQGGLGKEQVYVSTTDGEFSYSKNGNMFVLLMDTFDAKVMNDLLQSPEAEMCENVLTDFTYYPNTTAVYSNTYYSIPQLISGKNVEEGMNYTQYINAAYDFSNNDFYSQLKEEEWDCRIYTDTQLPEVTQEVIFDNLKKQTLTVSSHRRLGTYMLKLVGFRYAPQSLKQYFWFYSDDMKDMLDIDSETDKIFYWGNSEFFDGIDTIDVNNQEKVFAFYHLEGTHLPFYTTRDMVRTKTEVGINEEGLAMMNMIDKFCSRIKELNIYDNSVIVIIADHGHYDYHQSAVFMVKGIGEKHNFEQVEDSTTFADMQATWYNLLNGLPALEAVVVCDEKKEYRTFWEVDKNELSEMVISKDSMQADFTGKRICVE